MINWLALTPEQRKIVITSVSARSGLPEKAVEKDWWVTVVLKALFNTPFEKHLLFKGGTSLSKSWKLIQRFSEDIDIALDRELLGFSEGRISNSQIAKLRERACEFTKTRLKDQLAKQLTKMDIPASSFEITAVEDSVNADPQKLILTYPPLFEPHPYLEDKVIIEVSARSLREPFTSQMIESLIDEYSPGQAYVLPAFPVPTVNPERTILEKAFLLHEEFCKPPEKVKHEKKSRHFHDLHELMDTVHGTQALTDVNLYRVIVEHREVYNRIPGVDYTTLLPAAINFIPPDAFWKDWEADYESMRENMILGDPPRFGQLMDRMKELLSRFRQIKLAPKEESGERPGP